VPDPVPTFRHRSTGLGHYRSVTMLSFSSFGAFVHLCQALKAKFYVRIAKSKVNVIQDVYWAYFRCCSIYKDRIRFCVFKFMSSMMADISAEFTAKLHWFFYVLSFVLGYIIVLHICFSVCLGLVLYWLIVELKWSVTVTVEDGFLGWGRRLLAWAYSRGPLVLASEITEPIPRCF